MIKKKITTSRKTLQKKHVVALSTSEEADTESNSRNSDSDSSVHTEKSSAHSYSSGGTGL